MSEHIIPKRTYWLVFAALMVLLVLTVVASRIPFHDWRVGRWSLGPLGVVIALLIAAVKAVLVAMYFMHVRYATRLTRIFVFAGVFWLGILLVLTLGDYLTRGWLPASRGWTDQPIIPRP